MVSWPYIFAVLERWGFGPHFTNTLKALYSLPSARIRLQGCYSDPFQIARGTRQGCPLSPWIFAIAIESLAIAIGHNPDIQGVRCGELEHKCALFADDLLLFVTNPLVSVPNYLKVLKAFVRASGLLVNMAKSCALNISVDPALLPILQFNFPFSWSTDSIPYLGKHLTSNISSLYNANYPPLFRKLKAELSTWSSHTLSWLGRVNAIKMTLLPSILYLFCSLPIPVKTVHLEELKNKIIKLV